MKRSKLTLAAVSLLAVFLSALAVMSAFSTQHVGRGEWFPPPVDLSFRLTEAECLKMGVNPYDVWHGDIILKPFLPNWGEAREAVLGKEGFTEGINAYAPWEYSAILPLSFLPRQVGLTVYMLLMLGCLIVLFWVAQQALRAFSLERGDCLLVAALAILLTGLPIFWDFYVGNLTVISLTGVALMAYCLDRRRDVLAGFCWAVAMLKPPMGLVFAIPLLMRRKWVTCFVAAGTCALLAIPPAIMCHTSPVTLILQTPAAASFAFEGCGTSPYFLLSVLPRGVAINLGLVVGAAVCAWLTWSARQTGEAELGVSNSWFVYLMPAAVCAATWTYALFHAHVFEWFFFLVLCASLVARPRSKFLWGLLAVALVSATRAFNMLAFVLDIRIWRDALALPKPFYHAVDSLNSTLDLALCAALCLWRTRNAVRDNATREDR